MKKVYLSTIASLVLASNMQALTIEVKGGGWNLIGLSSTETLRIDDYSGSIERAFAFNGTNLVPYIPSSGVKLFSSLESGKGYWVKASKDFNITLSDSKILTELPTMNTGWNLIAGVTKNLDTINLGISKRIDTAFAFNGTNLVPYIPSSGVKLFNSLEPGKGYWFKISTKLTTSTPIKTLDGYEVVLYSSVSDTVPSDVVQTIQNSTLQELTTISNWQNITSIEISDGTNSTEVAMSSISSSYDNIINSLQGTATVTPVYVYGISIGSAPYPVADAVVYKIDRTNGTKELIGNTDINGFVYSSKITKGVELLIQKSGMSDKLYTVVSDSTEYIFLAEDKSVSIPGESVTNSTNKVLTYTTGKFYQYSSGLGYYLSPSSVKLKKNVPEKVLNEANIDTLIDSSSLKTSIESVANKGYSSQVLSSFEMYLNTGSFFFPSKSFEPFSNYYPVDYDPTLIVPLKGVDYQDVLNAKNGAGSQLRVFYYDGSSWQTLNIVNNVTLEKVSNETTTEIKNGIAKFGDETPVLKIKNTGFYPHVIVLDKKVVTKYPVELKVVDENSAPLKDAALFLGNSYLGTSDANGVLDFNLSSNYGATSFYVKASKDQYKPASQTVSIATLDSTNKNTIALKLEKVANVASIEGTVYDTNKNNEAVYLSKVKLYYPYALSYVSPDAEKNGKPGLEVGYTPNTTYKWYIRIHDNQTVVDGLPRVSADRWIMVGTPKTSAEGGNFLSYDDLKLQIIQSKDQNDPVDVKSMVSGEFDIAVVAEHDIDGDGNADIVELGTPQDATQTSYNTSEVTIDPYQQIIGSVKFNFDVAKLASSVTFDNDKYPAVKVNGEWYYGATAATDANKSIYMDNTKNIDDAATNGSSVPFNVNIDPNSFKPSGLDFTTLKTHDYVLTYKVGITGALSQSGNNVMLVNENGVYKWKKFPSSQLYERYAILDENNASIVLGQDRWNASSSSYDLYEGLVSFNRVAKYISQNEIMAKLNMTLKEIGTEAGFDATTVANLEDKPFIATGMDIVPFIALDATNDKGNIVRLVEGEQLALGSLDVTQYIKRGRVDVNPPISAPRVIEDMTDRSGKFIFPNLPLEYGKLNNKDVSLLTLNAQKYAHNDSPLYNVKAYSAGETVEMNVSLPSKNLVNVEVVVKDENNNSVDANVTIDGVYKQVTSVLNNFTEDTSIASDIGNDVNFSGIIQGIRTVTVTKDGYYPVILSTPVYSNNANKIDVTLKSASNANAIVQPTVSLLSYNADITKGIITLTLDASDKDTGGLFKDTNGNFLSEIVIFNNGKKVNAIVNMSENGIVNVTILNPYVGKNEIYAKIINPKGDDQTSEITIDFYPNVGSVKGYVESFIDNDKDSIIDSGYFMVVDAYDKNMNYISSVMTSNNGEFLFNMLPDGEKFIKAFMFNSYGVAEKVSNAERVLVSSGLVKKVTLTLEDQNSTFTIPRVDFDPTMDENSLATEALNNNGTVRIKGTVYDYDGKGEAFIAVNFVPIKLNSSDMTSGAKVGEFTFSKDVNLTYGKNEIFVQFANRNGFFDITPTLEVEYKPQGVIGNYYVVTEVVDETNSTIPIEYANVAIYNPLTGYYEEKETNTSGEVAVDLPYANSPYQFELFANNYNGLVEYIDLSKADSKDGSVDGNVSLTFKLMPETAMYQIVVSDVAFTQNVNGFNVPSGAVVKGFDVTVDISSYCLVSPAPTTVNYTVDIYDSMGNFVRRENITGNSGSLHTFDKEDDYMLEITPVDANGGKIGDKFVTYLSVVDALQLLNTPPVAPVVPTPNVNIK